MLTKPDCRVSNVKQAKEFEEKVWERCLKEHSPDMGDIKLNKGENFIVNENGFWEQKDALAKCVSQNLLNVMFYKLQKVLNLDTFSLLSSKGDKIYILVSANESVMDSCANEIKLPLQFELGDTDLLSMEPINVNLFPLRFCDNKPAEIKRKLEELDKLFTFLFDKDCFYLSSRQQYDATH